MSQNNQKSLDYLDKIPEKIYPHLITHIYRRCVSDSNQYSLQQRCACVLNIRDYLLSGGDTSLPDIGIWLDKSLAEVLLVNISEKKLLTLTRDNCTLTDEVIVSILKWLNNISLSAHPVDKNTSDMDDSVAFNAVLLELKLIKNDSFKKSISMFELNRRFALQRQSGWDLAEGIKSKMDADLLLGTHEIIKSSKQLQSIIQLTGRKNTKNYDEVDKIGVSHDSVKKNDLYQILPDEHSINSVTGVCRGDDISRMLPSELVLLGQNKLKMLWHARRAENQLLNYHFQGILSTHVPEFKDKSTAFDIQADYAVKVNGPIILCVDSSASMKGKAERIAKAVALETMRIAHLEKRQCYLYSFSGTKQIIEFELNLKNGWQSVINFLKLSFNGGTDINSVLLKSIEKLQQYEWKNADLLLVSDGHFKISDSVVATIDSLHLNARIFGIQVSHWHSDRFAAICQHTFRLDHVI